VAHLPVPTAEHVRDVLVPAYAAAGVHLRRWRRLDRATLQRWPSSWAKRLAQRPTAGALLLDGIVVGGGGRRPG
jgi:hypothetical protein